MARKEGSLGGEMRIRIREYCASKSNKTKRNYVKACASFDKWRKGSDLSNRVVRSDPRTAVEQWRDALIADGYAASTIHTYIAGVCCGLGIDMTGIARHGTSEDKGKSIGLSERAKAARERECNAKIVRFQMMVGGRRNALSRLKGGDLVTDESGELCVRFLHDKGGKTQLQVVAPEHSEEVRSFFENVGADELLFSNIDRDLDLHGMRAERARSEYQRYETICSTPEGRNEMRRQLWARYTNADIGCSAYLKAKAAGNHRKMKRLQYLFYQEMAEGKYYLRGANRRVAMERGRPTEYDRLALCCVSVFSLSHWRNEVTIKHYLL